MLGSLVVVNNTPKQTKKVNQKL